MRLFDAGTTGFNQLISDLPCVNLATEGSVGAELRHEDIGITSQAGLNRSRGHRKIGRESFSCQINIVRGVDRHGVVDIGSIAAQIGRLSQRASASLQRASRQRETQ